MSSEHDRRRRGVAAAVLAAVLFALAACTPRPDVADDAARAFLDALASHNDEEAGRKTDAAAAATKALSRTWEKLQAESVAVDLRSVRMDGSRDTVATATYHLDWSLPGDRHLAYDSSMTLTKSGTAWTVRWQPTVLHPALGADQHLELRSVPARTADVVGSDGAVLLTPGTADRVLVDTRRSRDLRATLTAVADALATAHGDDPAVPTVDPGKAYDDARSVTGTYSVAMVPAGQADRVAEALRDDPSVTLNEEPVMVRPDPGFAPDIMSRVNSIVSDELVGRNGWEIDAVNANGAPVTRIETHQPEPAPAVGVSLSKRVQDAAQQAVDTRSDAKAMMVVMRPSTGEILAVAQTPKADEDGDVALSGQYPPGSTFKIITASAGVQHQGLEAGSSVQCPGTQDIGGRIVTNYNTFSLGTTTLENAFAKSCNTTFASISSQLEPGQLKDTARQFGLGRDYDIPGLTTVTGDVPVGDTLLDRTEAGYGQGLDLVSPFGMALVGSSVAAGRVPTPTLIDDGHHGTEAKGADAPPLDPGTLDNLRQMMRAVVTNGSGSAIAGAGEVYGKTGEAEINGGSHAWFAGYRGDLAFATLIVLGGGSEHSVAVTKDFFARLDEAGGPEGSPG